MSNSPVVSILMPVYNTAPFLREAIDSILQQSFADFELIVLNDCSPDDADEILDSYCDQRIIRYKGEKNVGLANVLNVGLAMARGKYIARMDSDDISLPNRLQVQVDYLEQHPQIDLCSTAMKLFGELQSVSVLKPTMDEIKITALFYSPILHASSMWRREKFVVNNLFFDQHFVPAEDYRLWTLALLKGIQMTNLPDVLYKYRIHSANATKNTMLAKQKCAEVRRNYVKQIFPNATESFLNMTYCMDDYMENNPKMFWHFVEEIEKNNQSIQFFDPKLLHKRLHRTAQTITYNYLKTHPADLYLLGKLRPILFAKLLYNRIIPHPCEKYEKEIEQIIPLQAREIPSCLKVYYRSHYHYLKSKHLKNKSFTLLANNCNGTFLMYDMGLEYLTPIVNIYIPPKDFIRFLQNLDKYLSIDTFKFISTDGCDYPIGLLGDDVHVHFVHYATPDLAQRKWNERKSRIQYDNLFLMLTERDGCTYNDLLAFDKLPYKNKVVFTHKVYPEIKSSYYIGGCFDKNNPDEVGYLYEWKSKWSIKRWLDDFDYIGWLNRAH